MHLHDRMTVIPCQARFWVDNLKFRTDKPVSCPQILKIGSQMPLLDETVLLLKTRPVTITLRQIAKDIDVSPNWLSMLNNGEIDNPGIVSIQKLYDYLLDKKREQPELPV